MARITTTRNSILTPEYLAGYMFGGVFSITPNTVKLHNFDSTSYVGTYYGSFRTNAAGDILGTVTGFAFTYKTTNLFIQIKGLNLDARDVFALVGAHDIDGLMSLMFSRSDTFDVRSYQATYGTHSLSAYGGNDVVYGSSGDDLFLGGSGKDTLYGSIGLDTLAGESGADLLYGESGDDSLTGNSGIDKLFGGWGNDTLDGGSEADLLSGSIGNDRLIGSAGIDTLAGGAGNDAFVFHTPSDGGDIIRDFGSASGNDDAVYIDAAGFGLVEGGGQWLADNAFQAGPNNVSTNGEIRFIFSTSDSTLWFDIDGNGSVAPVLIADLQAGTTVSAADIWLF